MKQNSVNQKERDRILKMYGSKPINEEVVGNKTIADIQKLVGVKDDNILGPQTLAAIKAKLAQPSIGGEPKTGEVLKVKRDVTQTPEPIKMGTMTAKSINIAPTTSGVQVGVGKTGGEKSSSNQSIDSLNP
jgi:hypothetical protein